jgi:plasmid stabilization system protein ParE
MELSKQRSAALDRADRAERSSFESLAEMARVGRERDEAMKKLEVLQQRFDDLEGGNDK